MTRKMSSRTSRSVAVVSLLGAILICGLMAAPVNAQSNNPLDVLLAAVSSLQRSVNLLVAPAQANMRISPHVNLGVDKVGSCDVVNVAASPRTIRFEYPVSDSSGELGSHTATIEPGRRLQVHASSGSTFYCRFTVTDGTRTDIRAAVGVHLGGLFETLWSLPAE